MLFLVPLGYVPLCVAAGIMLGNVLELLDGRIRLERVLGRLGEAVYSLGPVLVLAAFGDPAPEEAAAAVLLGALAAQFAADFVSAATHTRIALGLSPRVFIKDLSVAWIVDAALTPVALLAAVVAIDHDVSVPARPPARRAAAHVRARAPQPRRPRPRAQPCVPRARRCCSATSSRPTTLYGLTQPDVVLLSIAVAEELQLDARARRDTEFVALLHDVGKIRIPNEIINKPGPLTPEERAIVETHTLIGEEMLDKVGGVLGNVGHLVRSCHERYDGGGYPDGLAGERIPLVARIVCCCDAYNAITTDRPYRAGRSAEEALAELRRCAGTHFDPVVVEALARVV